MRMSYRLQRTSFPVPSEVSYRRCLTQDDHVAVAVMYVLVLHGEIPAHLI